MFRCFAFALSGGHAMTLLRRSRGRRAGKSEGEGGKRVFVFFVPIASVVEDEEDGKKLRGKKEKRKKMLLLEHYYFFLLCGALPLLSLALPNSSPSPPPFASRLSFDIDRHIAIASRQHAPSKIIRRVNRRFDREKHVHTCSASSSAAANAPQFGLALEAMDGQHRRSPREQSVSLIEGADERRLRGSETGG